MTWSGACADGKATGEGRLVFGDGDGDGVYESGMPEGKLHGRGVQEWSDGFRYEGDLRDGRRQGQGTLTRADGTSVEGDWRDGCLSERSGRWALVGTAAAACGFE